MVNVKVINKGEKFGMLTTLGESEKRNNYIYEKCICDCGTVKWIARNHLRRGATKSCGCLSRRLAKERAIKMKTKHNMYGTHIYKIFRGMYGRCNNPKYSNYNSYGGKGIKLLWGSFEDFYNDMGESYFEHVKQHGEKDTTIDRIDSNGNYCKDNCKRSTKKEQQNNKTNNRFIIYKGKKYTLQQLSELVGLGRWIIKKRLEKGWDIIKACNTPIDKRFSHRKNKNEGDDTLNDVHDGERGSI